MLPPFIIDQIRKREIEERTHPVQPHLELPIPPQQHPPHHDGTREEENRRGVIIVDL